MQGLQSANFILLDTFLHQHPDAHVAFKNHVLEQQKLLGILKEKVRENMEQYTKAYSAYIEMFQELNVEIDDLTRQLAKTS